MMTREYPPEIYGGAGVHVTELTRFMRQADRQASYLPLYHPLGVVNSAAASSIL